ncbi:RHS repeat domain-containing protein [Dysgonomonas sp. BGC7]|uniref:RHS repeat domain-containing protein n=1 Tax=Dysgonomonas sp. BGC7 TaxID=1658008 RepID=UPI0006830060|nr:RHS repeat-associated core domain-containing protein [Dysgonomonas sp. BGC7]
MVDGGYCEVGNYYFYIQDHLGNNRVVAKADGTIVQKNHYYPFGMEFAENSGDSDQPYKYNGKELDKMHGLNMYDYSARYYEPAIGRFTTVDPLAEKYYSIGPYAYVGNNPLKYIDPDGKAFGPPDPPYYAKPRFKTIAWAQSNKIKAWKIGATENNTNTITSAAFRFSRKLNVVGESKSGAFTNAVRHTTWQAIMTSEIDEKTAIEVGNAHENIEYAELKYEGVGAVGAEDLADNIVDARNNKIGREIAKDNPSLSRKDLTKKVLDYYKKNGLWVSKTVYHKDGTTTHRLQQDKLTEDEYNNAVKRLEELDENGF